MSKVKEETLAWCKLLFVLIIGSDDEKYSEFVIMRICSSVWQFVFCLRSSLDLPKRFRYEFAEFGKLATVSEMVFLEKIFE